MKTIGNWQENDLKKKKHACVYFYHTTIRSNIAFFLLNIYFIFKFFYIFLFWLNYIQNIIIDTKTLVFPLDSENHFILFGPGNYNIDLEDEDEGKRTKLDFIKIKLDSKNRISLKYCIIIHKL